MSIKIGRACELANMLPRAQEAILGSIEPELIDRLTALELALVMKSLNTHWHKAVAFNESDILAEGCIYDPRSDRLIELMSGSEMQEAG